MFFAFGFIVGYATYKVLLVLSGKPVYTEQDFAAYGTQRFNEGYDQGVLESRWKKP